MQKFEKELQALINKHCVENEWDMPDFIMARLITEFITAVGKTMKQNLDWHGVDGVCHPKGPVPTELINVMNELDRTEFNSDESGLSDNGVSFYKALQQMSQMGLKKINYSDYAFKKKDKDHKIYVTISRSRPWF